MRHLAEFRDEAARAAARRDSDRGVLRGRGAREGVGDVQGQGLSGDDQAPQLRQRTQVARLAQRARPGLDRRVGDAHRACSRASADRARWATGESPRRALRSSPWTRSRTCCWCAARSRAARRRRGGAHRCLMRRCCRPAATAAKKVKLDDTAFGARFHGRSSTRACAPSRRLAGAGRPRPKHAAWSPAAAPSPGARRAPAARAPAPAARRSGPAVGPRSAPSRARTRSRSTARSSARRCAARSRCTPSAARSRFSTPRAFTAPKTSQAFDLLDDWDEPQPDARRARRRGVIGSAVLPQPRPRGGAQRRERRRHRPPRRGLAARLRAGARGADRARR